MAESFRNKPAQEAKILIEVTELTKYYGNTVALRDVNFSIPSGGVVGLLGSNGAGKSTVMNILTGYLSASSGSAVIGGQNILLEPRAVKRKIGYLPEQPPLYPEMTVREYLGFLYDLKRPGERSAKRAQVLEAMERAGVSQVSGRLIRNLSRGYAQRVGLAQALLGDPPVLILDEPTTGLDPAQVIEMRGLIRSLGEAHTVLLSSHILSEVQAVCSRVIVLAEGEKVADGAPSELTAQLGGGDRLHVQVAGPKAEVLGLLQDLPGIREVVADGEREGKGTAFFLRTDGQVDVRIELFRRLAQRDWPILELTSEQASLEEIFVRVTAGKEGRA